MIEKISGKKEIKNNFQDFKRSRRKIKNKSMIKIIKKENKIENSYQIKSEEEFKNILKNLNSEEEFKKIVKNINIFEDKDKFITHHKNTLIKEKKINIFNDPGFKKLNKNKFYGKSKNLKNQNNKDLNYGDKDIFSNFSIEDSDLNYKEDNSFKYEF